MTAGRRSHHCGFTLVELVITVAIIGVLASAALPLSSMVIQRGKESELRSALREIRSAIDAYKSAGERGNIIVSADASGYPPNLQVLIAGVENAHSPTKSMIYFLRRLPRDPMFPDAAAKPEETWAFRSYASPPDAPRSGEDVYDVHSLASGKGLNGVPYRDW